jgi:predicted DNA-binding transcriptional regulator YafY
VLVLAPKELREEITKELKASLKNYSSKTLEAS